MTTMRTLLALAAGMLLSTTAAEAQGKATELPKPAPEMSALDAFEGKWTCEGTMQPGPFGPGGKMSSTADIKDDLGGFWQSGRIKGTAAGMPPFEGMFHTTYDAAAKQYVMLWVDNMGAWSRSTSKGWEGDKMVYEGEMSMGGQKMMARDTFTKGPGTLKHAAEVQMEGKWTPMGEEACRRANK